MINNFPLENLNWADIDNQDLEGMDESIEIGEYRTGIRRAIIGGQSSDDMEYDGEDESDDAKQEGAAAQAVKSKTHLPKQ